MRKKCKQTHLYFHHRSAPVGGTDSPRTALLRQQAGGLPRLNEKGLPLLEAAPKFMRDSGSLF